MDRWISMDSLKDIFKNMTEYQRAVAAVAVVSIKLLFNHYKFVIKV